MSCVDKLSLCVSVRVCKLCLVCVCVHFLSHSVVVLASSSQLLVSIAQ